MIRQTIKKWKLSCLSLFVSTIFTSFLIFYFHYILITQTFAIDQKIIFINITSPDELFYLATFEILILLAAYIYSILTLIFVSSIRKHQTENSIFSKFSNISLSVIFISLSFLFSVILLYLLLGVSFSFRTWIYPFYPFY